MTCRPAVIAAVLTGCACATPLLATTPIEKPPATTPTIKSIHLVKIEGHIEAGDEWEAFKNATEKAKRRGHLTCVFAQYSPMLLDDSKSPPQMVISVRGNATDNGSSKPESGKSDDSSSRQGQDRSNNLNAWTLIGLVLSLLTNAAFLFIAFSRQGSRSEIKHEAGDDRAVSIDENRGTFEQSPDATGQVSRSASARKLINSLSPERIEAFGRQLVHCSPPFEFEFDGIAWVVKAHAFSPKSPDFGDMESSITCCTNLRNQISKLKVELSSAGIGERGMCEVKINKLETDLHDARDHIKKILAHAVIELSPKHPAAEPADPPHSAASSHPHPREEFNS